MNAPPASAPLVRAEQLAKRFGAVQAVGQVGFEVRGGEIYGLVGPDGAGKTTVMRMLAGVARPDSGKVVIDGVDVGQQAERAKRHLSYMPQRFGLYEDLTVDENIRFFADLFEVESRVWRARADEMLQACGLAGFRQRLVGQLSGGMKQKLGLTCALVHTPRVLLLDEPTTGVDPVSRREFWQILYTLRSQGVAILISTGYLDEAERCDRLALMHAGRIMLSGTPGELKARMPGRILEVPTAAPSAAGKALAGLPGVLGTLATGSAVHLHVDAAASAEAVAARLAQAGIAAGAATAVEPSVEDLFVALLPGQGGTA